MAHVSIRPTAKCDGLVYEEPYSILLQGRLSPEEYTSALAEFNTVSSSFKNKTRFALIFIPFGIFILAMIIGGIGGFSGGFQALIWTGYGIFVIFMIIFVIYIFVRRHKMKLAMDAVCFSLNQRYSQRGLNFKFEQVHKSTKIKIEIAPYGINAFQQPPLMYSPNLSPQFPVQFVDNQALNMNYQSPYQENYQQSPVTYQQQPQLFVQVTQPNQVQTPVNQQLFNFPPTYQEPFNKSQEKDPLL